MLRTLYRDEKKIRTRSARGASSFFFLLMKFFRDQYSPVLFTDPRIGDNRLRQQFISLESLSKIVSRLCCVLRVAIREVLQRKAKQSFSRCNAIYRNSSSAIFAVIRYVNRFPIISTLLRNRATFASSIRCRIMHSLFRLKSYTLSRNLESDFARILTDSLAIRVSRTHW